MVASLVGTGFLPVIRRGFGDLAPTNLLLGNHKGCPYRDWADVGAGLVPAQPIYRKRIFQMKITVTLLMLSALLLPTTLAQEYTELNLPEGAVGRLGKGSINVVRYSPDGAQLAIATSIGIWLYDIGNHREIALITTHPGAVSCVAFSPDGQLLAGGSGGRVGAGVGCQNG